LITTADFTPLLTNFILTPAFYWGGDCQGKNLEIIGLFSIFAYLSVNKRDIYARKYAKRTKKDEKLPMTGELTH